MQDNIQWIKGHKKTNWSLAHKPEFYMQMLKAGENRRSFNQAIVGEKNQFGRSSEMSDGTTVPLQRNSNIYDGSLLYC
jgi:hypothetical protein